MQIEVKSANDPDIIFKKLTHGKPQIDEEPEKEKIAAIILLVLGLFVLSITIYKVYRHCIKYELKKYLQNKSYQKYLKEELKGDEATQDKSKGKRKKKKDDKV